MNTFNYLNDTPTAKFTLKGFKGKREVHATIDSGASKSLIPVPMATDLGLKLKEVVDAIGVCREPVKVNVYWAEVYFMGKLVTDTILGFNLPVGKEAEEYKTCLIGRDVLNKFKIELDGKRKLIMTSDP